MKIKLTKDALRGQMSALYKRLEEHFQSSDKPLLLTVTKETRNLVQNAKLHAMLADISKQVEHCGHKFSLEVWKRLTMAQFLKECNEKPLMLPALDNDGIVVIYEQTSKLTVEQAADFITYLQAFGDDAGVKWSAPAHLMDGDRNVSN